MTEFRVGRIYTKRDDDAVLADKQTMRVPTMMRDGKTCDDCGGTGLYPASVRCPICSGTGGNTANTAGDRASLSDAEIQMQDRLAKDAAWRKSSEAHRAGWRTATVDSKEVQASRQALHDAYAEHERYITTAYRDLGPAFLNRSTDPDDWSTGAGNPARNFGKSPQQGDVCTIDGRAGHIGANGECIPDRGNEDSRSLADKMADHQRVMDDVYRNYEAQISGSYKTLR
jgi:hypothetical protein